jgi:spoIIIJ-associated protein
MKLYTAKTLELALDEASKELNIPVEDLLYTVEEEKKTLFSRKVTIGISETSDVIEYAETYVRDVIHALGLEVSLKTVYSDDIIKILIETNHNSLLIGHNGDTLQSLNELAKLAVSVKFKRKFRILLDIGDYKDKKYSRVVYMAKKTAHEVQKTHVDVKLEPMTPDERKKVHNALSTFSNIKTESIGDGKDRAIVVKYVVNKNPNPTTNEPVAEEASSNEEESTTTEESSK